MAILDIKAIMKHFGTWAGGKEDAENMRKIESFYEDIPIYGIDFETTDIYGRLKATIIERFGPKDKAKRRNTKTESLIAELLDNIDVEVK
jgi:predicted nucleic acid-binding protein